MKLYSLILIMLLLPACVLTKPEAERPAGDTLEIYESAIRAYKSGDMEAAEAGLKLVTERAPKDGAAWFRLGNVYAHTNRPDAAILAYQEALVRDPSRAKAWHNMGIVQIRQAANTFTELQIHSKKYDPLNARAKLYAESLLELLDSGEVSVSKLPTTNLDELGPSKPYIPNETAQ